MAQEEEELVQPSSADYMDLHFWPWACLSDADVLLQAFQAHYLCGLDSVNREVASRRLRLCSYHFIMSTGSLAKFLHKTAAAFPDIKDLYDAAEHLRKEGQYLRNMIEHSDINLRAKSDRSGFVRKNNLLPEFPGDRPGSADATSYIVDSSGHWLGGRLNVEKIIIEVRPIYGATERIPRWPLGP